MGHLLCRSQSDRALQRVARRDSHQSIGPGIADTHNPMDLGATFGQAAGGVDRLRRPVHLPGVRWSDCREGGLLAPGGGAFDKREGRETRC
jgi:hypothetical protein